MSEWQLYKQDDFTFLSLEHWQQAGVDMAFSTRWGGFSEAPFASCNLGLHVGDAADKVLRNRQRFLQIFQADLGQAVCCQQVHGDRVAAVGKAQLGQGAFIYEQSLLGYDAMITNEPGVFLLAFYADCLPVYLFDPVHRAIGLAHSGWKGTMDCIASKTLYAMKESYNSCSEDIYAAIGPGIGSCCFQISEDLAEKVDLCFSDFHDIIKRKETSGIYWDLADTIRQTLTRQGVHPARISSAGICTACHPENFFSYRREQGKTGRMGALLALTY